MHERKNCVMVQLLMTTRNKASLPSGLKQIQNMSLLNRSLKIDPLTFLSVIIILYILRMVVPYVNYIFIPFLFIYFLFTLNYFLKDTKSIRYLEVIKFNFYLGLISALFFWGFVITSSFIFPIFKELLNIVIILFLAVSIYIFVKNKESYTRFIKILSRQFILFSSLISILGLIKCYIQLRAIELTFLNLSVKVEGTSLTTDYNFYTLFSFIGIISVIQWLINFDHNISKKKKYLYVILLVILSFNILLSYSRRGFMILLIIIPLILTFIIYGYFKRKEYVSVFSGYLISFLLLILIIVGFVFELPVQMKKNVLNSLEISPRSYKYFTSTILYRYSTLFSKVEYPYYQNIVWNEKPDPRDPDSGWGLRVSTLISPLIGENAEIVPVNSIGYKMDRKCNVSTWTNNSYSFTDISAIFQGDTVISYNESLIASVYCFVSKDFDGTWARISTIGSVQGTDIKEYDMTNKGSWQKLSICFKNGNNIPPVYLYWAKYGVSDFSNLKGYVIFAYPEYKKIKVNPRDPETGWGSRRHTLVFPLIGKNVEIVPENSIGYKMDSTSNASTWDNNAYSYSDISSLFQKDSDSTNSQFYYALVYCYVSEDFDGDWARISTIGKVTGEDIKRYDLNKKGVWQKLEINFEYKPKPPPVYLYWSKFGVTDFQNLNGYIVFAYPEYYTRTLIK